MHETQHDERYVVPVMFVPYGTEQVRTPPVVLKSLRLPLHLRPLEIELCLSLRSRYEWRRGSDFSRRPCYRRQGMACNRQEKGMVFQ